MAESCGCRGGEGDVLCDGAEKGEGKASGCKVKGVNAVYRGEEVGVDGRVSTQGAEGRNIRGR